MTKDEYIRKLLVGRRATHSVLDAAFIFWHAGVPLQSAKAYMTTLESKMNVQK